MGRAKLEIKKIEEHGARQGVYLNRRNGVVKKADELSILCNTDVALTMFSPIGRPTTFASNGRSEEIYLRYLEMTETRRGHVLEASPIVERLKYLKRERELMEKISRREALKEELNFINQKVKDANDKLRLYIPEVEDIRSVKVAEFYERIISYALLRLERQWDELTSDWVNNVSRHSAESIKVPLADVKYMETMTPDSVNFELINNELGKGKVVQSVYDPEAQKINLASEVAYERRA